MESSKFRIESDSIGEMKILNSNLWGAQTQRSVENFPIGTPAEVMPSAVIKAFGIIKKACAIINQKNKDLDPTISAAIQAAAEEVASGELSQHFPLIIWQTGSGTMTNMNVNEVIANRAAQILNLPIGKKHPHPNDHVNKSQSSNDTFPSAMHVSTAIELHKLLKSLIHLGKNLDKKVFEFKDLVKSGRTHWMDATPLTLGQEFSAFSTQIAKSIKRVEACFPNLYEIPQGGTAVGTGLNTRQGWDIQVVDQIAKLSGLPFVPSINKFEAQSAHDVFVEVSGVLNTLATSLSKISNDIRLLASGPRCGIAEISLPANEPGSSIMPGKVNPTQVESITQIACQIMGNHVAITVGNASLSHFQLNVSKPMIISNILRSIRLLTDGCRCFTDNCVIGIKAIPANLKHNLMNSLMLATILNPVVGYDNASKIAKLALSKGISLCEASQELKLLTEEEFHSIVKPSEMTGPNHRSAISETENSENIKS